MFYTLIHLICEAAPKSIAPLRLDFLCRIKLLVQVAFRVLCLLLERVGQDDCPPGPPRFFIRNAKPFAEAGKVGRYDTFHRPICSTGVSGRWVEDSETPRRNGDKVGGFRPQLRLCEIFPVPPLDSVKLPHIYVAPSAGRQPACTCMRRITSVLRRSARISPFHVRAVRRDAIVPAGPGTG